MVFVIKIKGLKQGMYNKKTVCHKGEADIQRLPSEYQDKKHKVVCGYPKICMIQRDTEMTQVDSKSIQEQKEQNCSVNSHCSA